MNLKLLIIVWIIVALITMNKLRIIWDSYNAGTHGVFNVIDALTYPVIFITLSVLLIIKIIQNKKTKN